MEKKDEKLEFSVFSDRSFMLEALKEARKAFEADEVPVGCVIVFNNRIIARAHNLTERLKDPTAHAEMLAITAAANALGGKYLTDCTLFVSLEPCVMCAGALAWAQVGRIVYGASDVKRGFTIFAPMAMHPRTSIESGLEAEEASRLIKDFFARKR